MSRCLQQTIAREVGLLLLLTAAAGLLFGCTGAESIQRSGRALSDVLGTWSYRASGSQPLSQGTLQLNTTRGRLVARLRDAELGTVPVDARIHGDRLTLRLDLFRVGPVAVSGMIEDDTFRGLVDRPTYDVSMNQSETRHTKRAMRGSFLAERRGTDARLNLPFDCPRIGPDGLMPCR